MKFNVHTLLPIALASLLPGLSLYAQSDTPIPNTLGPALTWLFASVLMYLLWYLLWYVWDLKANYQKRGFKFAVIGMGGMVVAVFMLISTYGLQAFGGQILLRLTLGSCLFLTIQYALRAQENIAHLQLEKEQMQTENYRVQLQALRAQIDPHFLFNSLNTLRSMVRHQHANSEKFVMSLSDLYRKTLKHNENTTLPLSEELELLESYLFLMKSRNEKAISVHMDIDKDRYGFHLPTLALQVVVENCFKHNSMSSKMPLRIKISPDSGDYITVQNNLQPKLGEKDPSGLGLDMLRKRYELMDIPDGLIVEKTEDQFIVKLKLIPA